MEPNNDFLDNLGNHQHQKVLREICNEYIKDDEDLKPQILTEECNNN